MAAALLFDLDGTLIDSEPWHKLAEVEAFAKFGIQIGVSELEGYMGATLPDLLEGIGARFGRAIPMDEFLSIERPILDAYIHERMAVFPDAIDVIGRLEDRPRALVTSSMRWYVDAVFDRFSELKHLFSETICQADVAVGKPHPEGYLLAARRLNADPATCVVFEDSLNGVRAGLAAGARVVGIDRDAKGKLSAAHEVVADLWQWRD